MTEESTFPRRGPGVLGQATAAAKRQPGRQAPPHVVGSGHCGAHLAAETQRALATGEVRLRAAAPERDAAAGLAVERKGRACERAVKTEDVQPSAYWRWPGRLPTMDMPGPPMGTSAPSAPITGTAPAACGPRPGTNGRRRRGAGTGNRAARAGEAAEAASRQLAPGAAPQLAPSEAGAQAPRPGHLQPLLDVHDDVHGGGTPEAREKRPGQRVAVLDRADRRGG